MAVGWGGRTTGSGCVRCPQKKPHFRVILTQNPAILHHWGSQGPWHPPAHTEGSLGRDKASPLAQGRVTQAGGRGTEDGLCPPWVTAVSPAMWPGLSHARLQLHSSLHRGMRSELKPEPKSSPGACPTAPAEAEGDRGVPPAAPHLQQVQGGSSSCCSPRAHTAGHCTHGCPGHPSTHCIP